MRRSVGLTLVVWLAAAGANLPALASTTYCTPASAEARKDDGVVIQTVLHNCDTSGCNPNGGSGGQYVSIHVTNGGPTSTFYLDYATPVADGFLATRNGTVYATGEFYQPGGSLSTSDHQSCEITLQVNHTNFFSKTQKDQIRFFIRVMKWSAEAAAAGAYFCKRGWITYECAIPFTDLIAASAVGIWWETKLLEWDPLDMNYTQIPTLQIPQMPAVQSSPPGTSNLGVTYAAAYGLNAWRLNELQIAAVFQAAVTSMNRASGAASENNSEWEQRQTAAAQGFIRLLPYLLNHEADMRIAVVNQLKSENSSPGVWCNGEQLTPPAHAPGGGGGYCFTSAASIQSHQWNMYGGLSGGGPGWAWVDPGIVDAMHSVGMNDAMIAEWTMIFYAANSHLNFYEFGNTSDPYHSPDYWADQTNVIDVLHNSANQLQSEFLQSELPEPGMGLGLLAGVAFLFILRPSATSSGPD